MDDDCKKIIRQLETNTPVSHDKVDLFRNQVGIRMPEDFLEFFQVSNGASGRIRRSGGDVILWPLESLLENNDGYRVKEFTPGIFLFGSNGGGEAYAFDTRSWPYPVVRIPFVFELKYAEHLADSFTQFVKGLEASLSEGEID
jgi:SMI1 / KNR4 family (SUKH-1)